MSFSVVFVVIAILLVVWLLITQYRGGATRKFKITVANNEVLYLFRRWNDGWSDERDLKVYHTQARGGKRVILSKQYILKIEEE